MSQLKASMHYFVSYLNNVFDDFTEISVQSPKISDDFPKVF